SLPLLYRSRDRAHHAEARPPGRRIDPHDSSSKTRSDSLTETSTIETPSASGAASSADCQEVTAVARRAWRGIVTVAATVCVAVVTLGFAAAVLLVSGFIPLAGLEGRISAAIEERLGPNWKVEVEHAELSRADGRSRLRVREV